MTEYQVIYTNRARRDLKRLSIEIAREIIISISALKTDPLPQVKKLKGSQKSPFYSLHVDDYRVILVIQNSRLIVHVVEVGPRKTVYRKYGS